MTCVITKVDEPAPPKVAYNVISGDDSPWGNGSSGYLAITFRRSAQGEGVDEIFKHFRSASVDGRELVRDRDYIASEGSVVINLAPSFLATLSAGEHTLTAIFDDGSAEAKFNVAAQEQPSPTPETTPTEPTSDSGQGTTPTAPADDKAPADNGSDSGSAPTEVKTTTTVPKTTSLATTSDPTPIVQIAVTAITGAAFALTGWRRRKKS